MTYVGICVIFAHKRPVYPDKRHKNMTEQAKSLTNDISLCVKSDHRTYKRLYFLEGFRFVAKLLFKVAFAISTGANQLF